MITGTDPKSSKAMKILDQGGSIAMLVDIGLTRDQAKKLSRLYNMRSQSKIHLPNQLYQKLYQLGLKALVLHPLVKDEDWSGLIEIMETIEPNIKRSDLAKFPAALAEKRERIKQMEAEVDFQLQGLLRVEKEVEEQIRQIHQVNVDIEKALSFLDRYPKKIKDFLADHLGINEGKLCLAKRLDHGWQQSLRKRGVIQYNRKKHVHFVQNVDAVAKDLERRLKRGWRIYYDPEHVNSLYAPPEDPEYRNAQGLVEGSFKKKLMEHKKQLEDLQRQRKEIEKEIQDLRRKKPESFMEAVEVSNQLGKKDMKTHGKLQSLAMRWLYNRGYVAVTELTIGAYRCDVIGYNEEGRICIIEAKASLEDFRRDKKWQEYLPFCDEYYFAVESNFYLEELYATGVGILKADKRRLNLIQECSLRLEAKNRKATMFQIGRGLAKKFIYGY